MSKKAISIIPPHNVVVFLMIIIRLPFQPKTDPSKNVFIWKYTPTHYKIKLVPAGQGLLRLKGHENIIKSGDHSKKCNKNKQNI